MSGGVTLIHDTATGKLRTLTTDDLPGGGGGGGTVTQGTPNTPANAWPVVATLGGSLVDGSNPLPVDAGLPQEDPGGGNRIRTIEFSAGDIKTATENTEAAILRRGVPSNCTITINTAANSVQAVGTPTTLRRIQIGRSSATDRWLLLFDQVGAPLAGATAKLFFPAPSNGYFSDDVCAAFANGIWIAISSTPGTYTFAAQTADVRIFHGGT